MQTIYKVHGVEVTEQFAKALVEQLNELESITVEVTTTSPKRSDGYVYERVTAHRYFKLGSKIQYTMA